MTHFGPLKMIPFWEVTSNFEVVTQLSELQWVGSFLTVHLESSLSESTERDILVFGSFFTDFLNLRFRHWKEIHGMDSLYFSISSRFSCGFCEKFSNYDLITMSHYICSCHNQWWYIIMRNFGGRITMNFKAFNIFFVLCLLGFGLSGADISLLWRRRSLSFS